MSTKTRKSRAKPKLASASVHCSECKLAIVEKEQALFVEEDVGRLFCQESCIVAHFTPEIEKLEREYGRHVSAQDLNSEERERYAHFRWTTLENPEEVWVEKTATGDLRHTLISEFRPENKSENREKRNVYAVAICLMLQDEPSFLYLAFITSDRNLVDVFRKGEKYKVLKQNSNEADNPEINSPDVHLETISTEGPSSSDRLAEPWTEADSVRASILKCRKHSDISAEDFGFYQNCLEETLKEPTELWSYQPKAARRVYHFIRRYDHDSDYWYVVMAKDTPDETQIEIVEAFPTKDAKLVQMCRHGKKELFGEEAVHAQAQEPALAADGKRNVH